MNQKAGVALREAIDVIEASYEFMLAYAAQGRDREAGGGGPGSIRQTLTELSAALGPLEARFQAVFESGGHGDAGPLRDYLGVLAGDGERAKAAVDLVLATPSIGSLLIDNLNASIHLRALLTDIFLIDEALKSFPEHA